MRWAWAEIDLAAAAHNVRLVARAVAPAEVWAVVKADAYGHGVVDVAAAALDAGATGLCVALVAEGVELRRAGFTAPVLVLSEQPLDMAAAIVAEDLTPTVYTRPMITALADAADAAGHRVGVHLKIDTGMHRVGADPTDVAGLVDMIGASSGLRLDAVFTHLACADEPAATANTLQLQRLDDVVRALRNSGVAVPRVHAANSAAALALPGSRHDLVRLGVAMYGIEPGPGVSACCTDLRPVMSLHARVSMVKRVAAGERISYGLRHTFAADTVVATIPIGYADGVPRRLFGNGGEVLLHGCRVPIVGVVTMDQLMVDCAPLAAAALGGDGGDGGDAGLDIGLDFGVAVGDPVVLIGSQAGRAGRDTIRAEEWADRLGTIGYEIVCGVSKRIERVVTPHSALLDLDLDPDLDQP